MIPNLANPSMQATRAHLPRLPPRRQPSLPIQSDGVAGGFVRSGQPLQTAVQRFNGSGYQAHNSNGGSDGETPVQLATAWRLLLAYGWAEKSCASSHSYGQRARQSPADRLPILMMVGCQSSAGADEEDLMDSEDQQQLQVPADSMRASADLGGQSRAGGWVQAGWDGLHPQLDVHVDSHPSFCRLLA
jgi:hypothetical protein